MPKFVGLGSSLPGLISDLSTDELYDLEQVS